MGGNDDEDANDIVLFFFPHNSGFFFPVSKSTSVCVVHCFIRLGFAAGGLGEEKIEIKFPPSVCLIGFGQSTIHLPWQQQHHTVTTTTTMTAAKQDADACTLQRRCATSQQWMCQTL